ncbi:MAG: hypothetical protein ACYC63_08785 [Armatimonadota bacterium]
MIRNCWTAAIVVWLCAACLVAASAADQSSWVNVRDFGASGSEYSTGAVTAAGSKQITVKDVGDFQVGQGVMVSRCNVRYQSKMLRGPKKVLQGARALKDEVEIRGYDGAAGSWLIYALDVAPGPNSSFRWSDDIGRTWHQGGPLDHEWHALSGGTEVRFAPEKLDWTEGYAVTFAARDQLVTRIEKIEGNVLTLADAANRSADDAVVRHCDNVALQAAINQAIKEKRNVFVPPGWYRLAAGLRIGNASAVTMEGASAETVTLDISEGQGACVTLAGGTEVNLRNLTMLGNTGFADADIAGYFKLQGAWGVWGMSLRPCNAVSIASTERVLVENCHARKMSVEAFVSGGNSRAVKPPGKHTISTTYLRCSAIDCGRNAFNDVLCGSENTSVLYCRIVDVGGCAWEGAGRFIRFIGNYVRNSGTVAMGNLGTLNHDDTFPELGAGQHIIADNVFEGGGAYGGKIGSCAVVSSFGSTQVIISNNLFVNYNSAAIRASGVCDTRHYPAANTTIRGNIIDLTAVGPEKPVTRCGVEVSANSTTMSDNQIYVRGALDPMVTGIRVAEPALDVTVHDNLIRNCGTGLLTHRASSRVDQVVDNRTFLLPSWSSVPVARAGGHLYRGWPLVWLTAGKVTGASVIEGADPDSFRMKLREPREMKVGDVLEVYPPYGANWDFHHNTFTSCLKPVILDSYGSATSAFRDNILTREGATGVTAAVQVLGRFQLIGNHFSGFNEPGAAALALSSGHHAEPPVNIYHNNVFERCTAVIAAENKALWEAADKRGNLVLDAK